MLRLELTRVAGSWLQPDAARALTAMQGACGDRVGLIDVYRSVIEQIALGEGRAAPTKSGHNFGWSLDIDVKKTIANFAFSGVPELITASRDRNALARWMLQFGWHGNKNESNHFDFLVAYQTVLSRIDNVYGDALELNNFDVQRALNKLVGANLVLDGVLGPDTNIEMVKADKILNFEDRGNACQWWRRLLAGATAEIVEVTL